jgi:hypothetical protein
MNQDYQGLKQRFLSACGAPLGTRLLWLLKTKRSDEQALAPPPLSRTGCSRWRRSTLATTHRRGICKISRTRCVSRTRREGRRFKCEQPGHNLRNCPNWAAGGAGAGACRGGADEPGEPSQQREAAPGDAAEGRRAAEEEREWELARKFLQGGRGGSDNRLSGAPPTTGTRFADLVAATATCDTK